MTKVTIITATVGSKFLKQNIDSVENQTYKNIQHYLVVDGAEHESKVRDQIGSHSMIDMLVLPKPTGKEQYNGHRIYGASTFLAEGDYICYLDEDNWLEPNHIESLVNSIEEDSFSCSL